MASKTNQIRKISDSKAIRINDYVYGLLMRCRDEGRIDEAARTYIFDRVQTNLIKQFK